MAAYRGRSSALLGHMPTALSIIGKLEHDGDGIVSYRVEASSSDFRAATWAYGNQNDAQMLAERLRGFPKAIGAQAEFSFGSPELGTCQLHFDSLGSTGQCRVTVSIQSSTQLRPAESAVVCVDFLPADVDRFCAELDGFRPGGDNVATLGRYVA